MDKKTDPFIDSDVIIRLLTGDDPKKQASSASLFEKVEQKKITLVAPLTVVADCVYVLSSPRLYNLSRIKVVGLLSTVLRLPNFKMKNRTKRVVLRAFDYYASTNLDFSDAFIVASMQQVGSKTLYSFDAGFDRIRAIERVEP